MLVTSMTAVTSATSLGGTVLVTSWCLVLAAVGQGLTTSRGGQSPENAVSAEYRDGDCPPSCICSTDTTRNVLVLRPTSLQLGISAQLLVPLSLFGSSQSASWHRHIRSMSHFYFLAMAAFSAHLMRPTSWTPPYG
jgi:hypothetical protein